MPLGVLVPSYNTKRVYATWVRQAGSEMRPGTYKVSVPVRVTNATDDVIIPAGAFVTGALNTTPGLPSLDIQAPCTNDPDNFPVGGWQLQIEVIFPDAPRELYNLDVDIDGGEINLRAVVLVQTFPVPQPMLLRGEPGGVAALDMDGDVVDAEGEKVIAGPGGGASTVEELTDASDVGKQVVQAETGGDIRSLIGAAPTTAASATAAGLVELATTGEATAGTDTVRAVTPAGLGAALTAAAPVAATTTSSGLVELATVTEATVGTDTARAVTPAGVAAVVAAAAAPASTTAVSGLVELATTAEATAGTDTTRAVTPAGLAAGLAALVAAAPGTLNTLDELAAALGDDPNFATTLASALATKAVIGLSPPVIYADSPTTCPNRSTWIAANCPSYTGPVVWNTALYLDHPGPSTALDGDELVDRIEEA